MVLQEVLVIIKPINTYDMTILATKITQIGQLRPKLWYFFTLHKVNNFSPSSFWCLFNVFTPNVQPSTFLVIIKPIWIFEMTILAQKNHSNWCNETCTAHECVYYECTVFENWSECIPFYRDCMYECGAETY